MASTLYICYFGVREPLVQTQVIPYLVEIMKSEVQPGRLGTGELEVSLLTFEPAVEKGSEGEGETGRKKERDAEFAAIRERLAERGIDWHWLPYHKRPSAVATAWDIIRGAFYVWRRLRKFDILHGRVHVPTLMAAVARKFSRHKPKLLFDIRGFFPEEYTDAGIWPEGGWLYRGAKRVERWLLKESDGFVVLTERAKHILFGEGEERPVEVIPCCVDLKRFDSATPESRKAVREELGIVDRRVGVYVGAFGGWYMAEETAAFFGAMKRRYPNSFALILTQSKRELIEPLLTKQGYFEGDFYISRVPSAEIPRYLSAADLAVSFIKPCYSKQASSPTKNAEYLACGLPIVANSGIGDVDELILRSSVGALITRFDDDMYISAIDEIDDLGDIAEHCRKVSLSEFDLQNVGGVKYRRLYSRLFE